MADRVTRPSNASAHPGVIDRNPARRSKDEVLAERQAKAAAKARGKKEKAENIRKIAAIEHAEKQKARILDQDPDDPRGPPPSQPKARRVRPRAEENDGDHLPHLLQRCRLTILFFLGPAGLPAKKRRSANITMESEDICEGECTENPSLFKV
jgi:hypothetical protein